MSEPRSGPAEPHAVNDLYVLVERGSAYFESLGQHSKDTAIRQACARMAQAKRAFAASLAAAGQRGVKSRASAPDPYARLGTEITPTGLDELEAIEDRLLRAVEGAIAGVESGSVRVALKAYLPQSQSSHAELRRCIGRKPGRETLKRRGLTEWLSGKRPRE